MKADDKTLQEVYGPEQQFTVPVFQRRYSWDEKNWKALWSDIRYLLEDTSETDEHFIGAFVCMAGDHEAGQVPDYLVIDGQQRLVTFAILLCAIRDRADQSDDDDTKELADEIHDRYLFDKYKDGLERYCIVSRAEDRDALFALLSREELNDEERKTSIGQAYRYFSKCITKLALERGENTLQRLRSAIMQQMPLALITADEEENPYAIFETLNERGVPLKESDLIRNYVFMHLDLDEQDVFNEEYWKPFEERFAANDGHTALDLTRFYRTYLMRHGDYVKKNGIYTAFRQRIDIKPTNLVNRLDDYGELYIWINRPSRASEEWLTDRIERYNSLSIGTADPLLISLLRRYQNNEIGRNQLERVFDGLESFAIRRSICGESTRGYFRTFPNAAKKLDESGSIESILSYLGEKGWPSDDQFKDSLLTFDIYNREKAKARLLLETFEEQHGHKEPITLHELTIEHVLPQVINPGDKHGRAWTKDLGDMWEQKHQNWVHTIGNLTLTGYNPELSNKRFEEKKRRGLENSNLELNGYFQTTDQWTIAEINNRGEKLANLAADIWPVPSVVGS